MKHGEHHLLGIDVLTRIHQLSVLAGEVCSALAYTMLFDVDKQVAVLCDALTQDEIDREQILALSASAAVYQSQQVEA